MISNTLSSLLSLILNFYIYIILFRVLLEWIHADAQNPLSKMVIRFTQPPVDIIKKVIPRIKQIDLSSIFLLIIVGLIKLLLVMILSYRSWPNLAGLIFWLITDLASQLINLYTYIIIMQALLSWIASGRGTPFAYILHQLTHPILKPIQKRVPKIANFDISPLIAILIIQLINSLIISRLSMMAIGLTL